MMQKVIKKQKQNYQQINDIQLQNFKQFLERIFRAIKMTKQLEIYQFYNFYYSKMQRKKIILLFFFCFFYYAQFKFVKKNQDINPMLITKVHEHIKDLTSIIEKHKNHQIITNVEQKNLKYSLLQVKWALHRIKNLNLNLQQYIKNLIPQGQKVMLEVNKKQGSNKRKVHNNHDKSKRWSSRKRKYNGNLLKILHQRLSGSIKNLNQIPACKSNSKKKDHHSNMDEVHDQNLKIIKISPKLINDDYFNAKQSHVLTSV